MRRLIACERVLGDPALDERDLGVEVVNLAQTPIDSFALVGRQIELGQPDTAAAAEDVAHRRPALEVAHQRRVDLVLCPRALSHQLRPTGQAPAQRSSRLVRQPAAVQQPGGQQPRERARVAAVGLDLGLGDCPQLVSGRHDHVRHLRLKRPRDRQRVARRLQRHVILGPEAVGEDLQAFRTRRHATPRAHPSCFADRDLAEIAMNV